MPSRKQTVNKEMAKTVGTDRTKTLKNGSDKSKVSGAGSFMMGGAKIAVLTVAGINTLKYSKMHKLEKEIHKLEKEIDKRHAPGSVAYYMNAQREQELKDKRRKLEKINEKRNKGGIQNGILHALGRMSHTAAVSEAITGDNNQSNSFDRSSIVSNTGGKNNTLPTDNILAINEPSESDNKNDSFELEC